MASYASGASSALATESSGLKTDMASYASEASNALATEASFARRYEGELASRASEIEAVIPNQASPTNQLADKEFVNSSIGTNTANYISDNGEPFTSIEALKAYSGTVTNNDYAFVTGTEGGNSYYDRYKATVVGNVVNWSLEYRLNNSSFTSEQWAAINSGITDVLVAKITSNTSALEDEASKARWYEASYASQASSALATESSNLSASMASYASGASSADVIIASSIASVASSVSAVESAKVSKSGDTMSGALKLNNALYLTNIAGSVHDSVSKIYFGSAESPKNYISANTSGAFGIYDKDKNGITCYPAENFFSTSNIDLGRSNNPWGDFYLTGSVVNDTASITSLDLIQHPAKTNNPHNVTKAQVGLGNVDNTSDADKPISTAAQTALNTKFDTVSITGTGNAVASIEETGTTLKITKTTFNNYTLPKATTGTLGGVIVGDNLTVDASGVLSALPGVTTETTGSGNAVTAISDNGSGKVTAVKGATFSLSNHTHSNYVSTATASTGTGNAITSMSVSGNTLTYNKETTFIDEVTASGTGNAVTSLEITGSKIKFVKGATYNNYNLPIAATGTLGGVKVGTNLSINASGVLSAVDTTYANATSGAAGLMSAADKTKLDGIATGANKYSLPTAATGTLGGVKVGSNITIDASGVISPTKTGVTAALGYTPPTTNTTYSAATTTYAGLMSTGAQSFAGNKTFTNNVIIGSATISFTTGDGLTITF